MTANTTERLDEAAALIASELAAIDGFDAADDNCGLYDVQWTGGPTPEPLGDAWNMDYLPKGERIAKALAQYESERAAGEDGCVVCGAEVIASQCDKCGYVHEPPAIAPAVVHGVNCKKVAHDFRGGYLHDAYDDTPYNVDGISYCGRCHTAIPAPAPASKSHHFPAVSGDENTQNSRACDACGIRYGDAGIDERCPASPALPTVGAEEVVAPLGVYVASRVRHARMWQQFRRDGVIIASSWIDEAGEGETGDFGELWARIEREIRSSRALVLYAQENDFPLKGALVEVGMALAVGVPVFVYTNAKLDGRTMRPMGSWILDRRVTMCESIHGAVGLARTANRISAPAPSAALPGALPVGREDELIRRGDAIATVKAETEKNLVGFSVRVVTALSAIPAAPAQVSDEMVDENEEAPLRWPNERIIELANRLVAPGPSASHVSASECHEPRADGLHQRTGAALPITGRGGAVVSDPLIDAMQAWMASVNYNYAKDRWMTPRVAAAFAAGWDARAPSPPAEAAKVEARHWAAAKESAMLIINAAYDNASHGADERGQAIYASMRDILEQVERRATALAAEEGA